MLTNRLDFDVQIIDPCLEHAELTAVLQTDPDTYWYTGDSPSANFNLEPFTITPVGFCNAVHSCTVISGPRQDLCNLSTANSRGIFSAGTGNYKFEADDITEVIPGTYVFEITAKVGVTTSTVSFTLVLGDPCENQ